ncbi:restriction endonuclease [Aeromonas media]|uniref:restriction endonuclease n=1 Tax=Aeromonas media TaxID=651 RepID=UPI00143D7756|nr:restriction endonuclease [Aeromonas media]MBS4700174.1 restriction endonuclease [Aeromonas media]QIY87549.1 restriction endonuclease [Aeromonas hydrophila]
MARIWFAPGDLVDHLHELMGYKAGLAASIEQICDLTSGSSYADEIVRSESHGLAIRSEDYEDLYYHLLYKVGITVSPRPGLFTQSQFLMRLAKDKGFDYIQNIQNIYSKNYELGVKQAIKNGQTSINPEPMIMEAFNKYGKSGANDIFELIKMYDTHFQNSPHTSGRWEDWKDIIDLNDLFEKHHPVVSHGTFLDQRFINYLSSNYHKIGEIHWRKFEEIISECFVKSGYNVELGPGSNDDGVDIRVWNKSTKVHPEYIIQCKRYKSKIDKVTVKGLYADVLEEKADTGLLVTTSEFSPGARSTISARNYPIKEVNGEKISLWLNALRTPGSGIIRV